MGTTGITDLPNEILFSIFSYLKMFDLRYRIPAVCKQWESIAKDRRLWRVLSYETTSEGTKTFGRKSWDTTLKFLETTPQLQNIVISQGHSESEVAQILNALDSHCFHVREIELEATPAIARHLASLSRLTDRVESLRLRLAPNDPHQRDVFKSLARFPRLRRVTFVNANPKHKDFQSFLASCPHLEHLNVCHAEFCRTSFDALTQRRDRFVSLFLRIDDLDRGCVSDLCHFLRLRRLFLVDNNASPEKLVEIGHIPCLESLLLREDASSPVLTSSALTQFLRCGSFSNLKELKLHKSRLNDEGAAEIRRNCPALVYLEVITYPKSRSGLSETALVHFLHCKRLESFEITFDSSNETDWIYRRIRHVKHDCDINGTCPMGLDELLLSWDEVQIPID